jgi:hypothetical protein
VEDFFSSLELVFEGDRRLTDSFLLLPVSSSRVMQSNPSDGEFSRLMDKYSSVESMPAAPVRPSKTQASRPSGASRKRDASRDHPEGGSEYHPQRTLASDSVERETDDVRVRLIILVYTAGRH